MQLSPDSHRKFDGFTLLCSKVRGLMDREKLYKEFKTKPFSHKFGMKKPRTKPVDLIKSKNSVRESAIGTAAKLNLGTLFMTSYKGSYVWEKKEALCSEPGPVLTHPVFCSIFPTSDYWSLGSNSSLFTFNTLYTLVIYRKLRMQNFRCAAKDLLG